MQTMLNKTEKKQLVINLYEEGKPIREIAQQAHLSFGTIGKIIKQINAPEKDEAESEALSNKSKETKALYLFLHGKRPVEVAIELDLSSVEVEYIQQEFWLLNQLDDLALAYLEVKSHLDLFLRLFQAMKKNKLINQKDIQTVLKYAAHDLPSLENRVHKLANDVIDLEIKKKEGNAQLMDLVEVLNQYQNAIEIKKEQLIKMDACMSQPAIRRDKSKPNKP
jgi:transposase